MAQDTESIEPAIAPAAQTAARPGTSGTGLVPIVSVLVRLVQLLLCIVALAVTASIKETGFSFLFSGDNLSFTNYDAFIFQLVACCFVFLYTFSLLVLASLKLCNLFGGIYRTNIIWWGQVIGDLLLGEFLFAAACSGGTIAAYIGKFGTFVTYYTLANASVAFAFLTSFTLLASGFVLIFTLIRNKI